MHTPVKSANRIDGPRPFELQAALIGSVINGDDSSESLDNSELCFIHKQGCRGEEQTCHNDEQPSREFPTRWHGRETIRVCMIERHGMRFCFQRLRGLDDIRAVRHRLFQRPLWTQSSPVRMTMFSLDRVLSTSWGKDATFRTNHDLFKQFLVWNHQPALHQRVVAGGCSRLSPATRSQTPSRQAGDLPIV